MRTDSIVDSGKLKPTRQEVKRLELNFTTNKDLQYFENGDAVNQDDGAASGIVALADADNSIITLSEITGTWGPENTGRYAIGPTKGQLDDARQYLKLDQATLKVVELQSAETAFTPITTLAPKIQFGSTLGTADTPDDVLPAGTTIQTEVMASNSPTDFDTKVSNQITPISVSGPQATMYGLRFEGQRKTKLYFPNPGTGSRKATVSMWFKHTKSNDFYALFSQGQDSNNDGFFTRFRIENGKLRVETAQAAGVQQVFMVTSSVIPDKLWQHLVVSFDSDSDMIMYLNGQEVGRRALESTGKYPWEAGRDTNIGCLGKNASGDDIQFYEGYLSDVFYVEGQDLPPETFGEDFEGKWGPLDSSKVVENIGITPVDETDEIMTV